MTHISVITTLTLLGLGTTLSTELAAAASETMGHGGRIAPRIVNGVPVKSNYMPALSFVVKPAPDDLRWTPEPLCGASLIHSDILLTAAHCQGAFHYGVMFYDDTTDSFSRKAVIDWQVRHPQWDYYGSKEGALNYDVLLMRLEIPIPQDHPSFQPISYNSDSAIPTEIEQGNELNVYGFGRTETGGLSQQLRHAFVRYISNEECTRRFRENGLPMALIPDDMMCTTQPNSSVIDVSTCNGDSGGPVTTTVAFEDGESWAIQEILVGVISAGIGCSTEKFPNGHVRTSSVATWIQQEICRVSRVPPKECPMENSTIQLSFDSATTILLAFTFDYFPQETLFAIRSLSDQAIVYSGPEFVAERNAQINSTIYLMPGNYAMEVYDTYGNGMMGRNNTPADPSNGRWELYFLYENGTQTLLANRDGIFFQKQTTTFEVVAEDRHSSTSTNGSNVENLDCASEHEQCVSSEHCCQGSYCTDGFCISPDFVKKRQGIKEQARIGGQDRKNDSRPAQVGGSVRRALS